MPDFPSLWPEDIKPDVALPLTILTAQARHLATVTRGVLTGDVESTSSTDDSGESESVHRLLVVAPRLAEYRHVILTAVHKGDLPYPVMVSSPYWRADGGILASDDISFLGAIENILTTPGVKSVLLSLLARSAEARSASD